MQCNYNSFIQIINFHGLFRNAPRCRKTGACRILVLLRYFTCLYCFYISPYISDCKFCFFSHYSNYCIIFCCFTSCTKYLSVNLFFYSRFLVVHFFFLTIGAFPHTKKARFESRFKSRLFLRVSTQAEKSAIWIATIFLRVSPQRQKNRDPNRTGSSELCMCIVCNRQRTQTAERPLCMMGYKKPVRFSFTVLTHFAQKIVAIISNNRDYFQKDALLVVRGSRSESH